MEKLEKVKYLPPRFTQAFNDFKDYVGVPGR